jgi:hypothetical protein
MTFRYDKSATNRSIRKYMRMHDSLLCPIARSLSILHPAHAPGISSSYPIGIFCSDDSGAFIFLEGKDVQHVMRTACKAAYPDAMHFPLQSSHGSRRTLRCQPFHPGSTGKLCLLKLISENDTNALAMPRKQLPPAPPIFQPLLPNLARVFAFLYW